MKNLSELTYEELCDYTKTVIDSLVLRAYEKGYKEENKLYEKEKKSTTKSVARELFDVAKPVTFERANKRAQEIRDRIAEKAKADVKELEKMIALTYRKFDFVTKADYVVNQNKRTVVALVRYRYGMDNSVLTRGIAKCAPDDCFNVHIGKAIALRRALGLEVPDEYLNSPQPTEMQVGDYAKTLKVSRHGSVHAGKIVKIDEVRADGSVVVIPTDEPDNNGIYSPQDLELITEKPWKKGDKVRHKRTGKVVTVYAYQPEKRTYGREAGHKFSKVSEGFTYIDELDYEFWNYIANYELVTESEYVPVEGDRI